jgi:O-antigen/teichoic acid export membrane protein/glycosyltransferase involved in cell wall biosynthesis
VKKPDLKNPEGGSLPGPAPAGTTIDVGARRLAKNTALNFVGYVTPLVIGFITLPFVIRGLGTERFGILSLIWVVFGYFSFLDLGLGRATIRFVADALGRGEPDKISEYVWTSVIIQAVLACGGALVMALLAPLVVERILQIPAAYHAEVKTAFYLMALSMPVIMVSTSFRGVLEGCQRFDLVNLIKIPASSANYLIPFLSLLFWKSLIGIVVLLFGARLITLGLWIFLSFRQFPLLRKGIRFWPQQFRPLMSYGGWATVSSFIGAILENLDRFVIGAVMTVRDVSFYSAPYEAVGRLGILPNSLVTALFPVFSLLQARTAEDKIRNLFARTLKYTLIVVGGIIIPIILLARTILRLWLGGEFPARSGTAFQLIAAGFLFAAFTCIAFNLIQGLGRTDITGKIHILLLLIYVPLLWAGVHYWGINGAAAAWFVHLGLQAFFHLWAVRRLGFIIDLRWLRQAGLGRLVLTLAAFAGTGIGLGRIVSDPLAVAAGGILYLLITWFWVLTEDERQWLWTNFRRRTRPGFPPAETADRKAAGAKKILYVGLIPPEIGGGISCGVATQTWDLAVQSARRGYEVAVLAPTRAGRSFVRDGVRVYNASSRRIFRLLRAFRWTIRLSGPCRKSLAFLRLRERIRVLAWVGFLDEAVRAFRPLLVHIHPLCHPLGGGLECLKFDVPVVFTDHGFWQSIENERDAELVRRAALHADGIISVSGYCRVQQKRFRVQVRGVESVILNPVDDPNPPAEEPTTRPQEEGGRKKVMFIAGVEPVARKGLDLLIDAFAGSSELCQRCELHIVSNREGQRYARPRFRQYKIAGSIQLEQTRDAISRILKRADLLVLPSRSEAFGLVLVEAAAAGVPVVGFAPTVEEFRSLMKIDIGEPFDAGIEGAQELADKILRVCGRRFNRRELSAKTLQVFSWDTIFPLYDRFYDEVLKR